MQGKVVYALCDCAQCGITPACAGKSHSWSGSGCPCWDHPRMCGEKHHRHHTEGGGSGITPAYAGKMRCPRFRPGKIRDHPRTCGGKAAVRPGRFLRQGITPACAGKRAQRPLPAQTCGDHPRMCGEKIRSFTCGSACRSGRIMPGISSISVSSAHDGHQPKAVGLAASHALTQQCPELL